MPDLYHKIAATLDDFAKFERTRLHAKDRAFVVMPCEACGKHCQSGLCPDCLNIAAGACRMKGGKSV